MSCEGCIWSVNWSSCESRNSPEKKKRCSTNYVLQATENKIMWNLHLMTKAWVLNLALVSLVKTSCKLMFIEITRCGLVGTSLCSWHTSTRSCQDFVLYCCPPQGKALYNTSWGLMVPQPDVSSQLDFPYQTSFTKRRGWNLTHDSNQPTFCSCNTLRGEWYPDLFCIHNLIDACDWLVSLSVTTDWCFIIRTQTPEGTVKGFLRFHLGAILYLSWPV